MVNVDSQAQLHNAPMGICLNRLTSQKYRQDIHLMAAFLIIIIWRKKFAIVENEIPDGNCYYYYFNSPAASVLYISV